MIPVVLGEPFGPWVALQVSPIFQMHRGKTWHFRGGLPLYIGNPAPRASLYLAIVESDRPTRHVGDVLGDIFNARGKRAAVSLITAAAQTLNAQRRNLRLVRPAFALLTQAIEAALRANNDDLRYTDVFTMKNRNDYLKGEPIHFGNDRIRGIMEVEVE